MCSTDENATSIESLLFSGMDQQQKYELRKSSQKNPVAVLYRSGKGHPLKSLRRTKNVVAGSQAPQL